MEAQAAAVTDQVQPGSGPASYRDGSNAVSVREVSKVFETGTTYVRALHDCTLEVEGGSFVSVIGPSGCGKSTLLRIVSGLLEPDAGEVVVGGRSPQENREDKMFGFVPQTPSLMPWRSVLANVQLLSTVNRRADRRNSRPPADEIAPARIRRARRVPRFLSA